MLSAAGACSRPSTRCSSWTSSPRGQQPGQLDLGLGVARREVEDDEALHARAPHDQHRRVGAPPSAARRCTARSPRTGHPRRASRGWRAPRRGPHRRRCRSRRRPLGARLVEAPRQVAPRGSRGTRRSRSRSTTSAHFSAPPAMPTTLSAPRAPGRSDRPPNPVAPAAPETTTTSPSTSGRRRRVRSTPCIPVTPRTFITVARSRPSPRGTTVKRSRRPRAPTPATPSCRRRRHRPGSAEFGSRRRPRCRRSGRPRRSDRRQVARRVVHPGANRRVDRETCRHG